MRVESHRLITFAYFMKFTEAQLESAIIEFLGACEPMVPMMNDKL